jgi:hypothetical protein
VTRIFFSKDSKLKSGLSVHAQMGFKLLAAFMKRKINTLIILNIFLKAASEVLFQLFFSAIDRFPFLLLCFRSIFTTVNTIAGFRNNFF